MPTKFILDTIEAELKRLRYQCGLILLGLRHATGPGDWGFGTREHPSEHGTKLKKESHAARQIAFEEAKAALRAFIAEHRAIMGPDWIGNDHGRLCWNGFCGGYPINQHYCQREHGHEGDHANEIGAWTPEMGDRHATPGDHPND